MSFFGIFGLSNNSNSSYIAQAQRGGPVTVRYDDGGYYNEYVNATDKLRAEGTPVSVTGRCISGCTLALTLPQLRVSPGARFEIHGAHIKGTKTQVPSKTQEMFNSFPPAVQALIRKKGGIPNGYYGSAHAVITGRELIAAGWPSTDGRNRGARAPVVQAARAQPVQTGFANPFTGVIAAFKRLFNIA